MSATMIRFTIDHSGPERHERSAELARAILASTDRSLSELEVVGIEPLLTNHVDAESAERLRDAGVQVDDETLRGTVDATPAVVDAVLSLFSDSLLVARLSTSRGRRFSRATIPTPNRVACWPPSTNRSARRFRSS
ncbi:hypothetical protein [Halostagnicola kamekurae]|nr:hypothetical protein [Halostagnicola kamekurae]